MPLVTLDLHTLWDLDLYFVHGSLSIVLRLTQLLIRIFSLLWWIVLHLDGGSQLQNLLF